jgi:hypothetical protein
MAIWRDVDTSINTRHSVSHDSVRQRLRSCPSHHSSVIGARLPVNAILFSLGDSVLPVARFAAAMHKGVNTDTVIGRFPAVIKDVGKSPEYVATNLRALDNSPAKWVRKQLVDGGLGLLRRKLRPPEERPRAGNNRWSPHTQEVPQGESQSQPSACLACRCNETANLLKGLLTRNQAHVAGVNLRNSSANFLDLRLLNLGRNLPNEAFDKAVGKLRAF